MEPVKPAVTRDENGRIKAGSVSLNPEGRPKGQTMKEFAREFLMKMSPEEKVEWLKDLSAEIIWKMAEGNPHTTQDTNVEVKGILCLPSELMTKNEIKHESADPSSGTS